MSVATHSLHAEMEYTLSALALIRDCVMRACPPLTRAAISAVDRLWLQTILGIGPPQRLAGHSPFSIRQDALLALFDVARFCYRFEILGGILVLVG